MVKTDQLAKLDDPMSLVRAILNIDEHFNKLLKSGLNKRAITVLLHDLTKVPKRDIEAVLSGLKDLKKNYCSTDVST